MADLLQQWARVHALMSVLERLDLPPLTTLDVYGVQGGTDRLSVGVWLKHAHDADRIVEVLPWASFGWSFEPDGAPRWTAVLQNRRALRGAISTGEGVVDVTVYAPVLERVSG